MKTSGNDKGPIRSWLLICGEMTCWWCSGLSFLIYYYHYLLLYIIISIYYWHYLLLLLLLISSCKIWKSLFLWRSFLPSFLHSTIPVIIIQIFFLFLTPLGYVCLFSSGQQGLDWQLILQTIITLLDAQLRLFFSPLRKSDTWRT